MPVDKNSHIHLYIQIADNLRNDIAAGKYSSGMLPTEEELCRQYGVSRYPMRQAMALLVGEGLLCRVRGRGTFVSASKPGAVAPAAASRSVALVLPGLIGDFPQDILRGFERAAAEKGFATFISVSGSPGEELAGIERAIQCGASGLAVFPISDSLIDGAALDGWVARGVYLSLIDRNPGVDHIDFVASDNAGGGYLAARHMSLQGYASAVFVADQFRVSSVRDRFEGFQRGLQQFGIRLLNDDAPFPGGPGEAGPGRYGFQGFLANLEFYGRNLPFAVLAENDYTAERVLAALRENGAEAGVIGFDNSGRCDFLSPPLTSIAQNGYLIGETAAKLAIEKVETGSRQSVRHILPTQLVARKSCGEGRAGGG